MTWPLLAQAGLTDTCGEPVDWLCRLVLETTDNEALASSAGTFSRLVAVVLALIVAWVLTRVARRAVHRFGRRMEGAIEERLDRAEARGAITAADRYRTRRQQRLHATTGVISGVLATAIWLGAIFWILSHLGVRLQPFLAGAGLLTVVIGFGAQQLVRDVLAGIAMLIEDQYGVGDWIEVDGFIGMVERVGLRSTAFRDLDGTVHHVLNGYIQRVGNLSQEWARTTFDVPVALDADVPATKALIHRVATELAEDRVWGEDIIGPPEIWGVQHFGPDGLKIRVVIPTKPLRNWDVLRQLRERLQHAFEQAHVRMPTQLIDVGGQRSGYTLLTSEITEDQTARRPHRRGLVPPDVGPFDRPPPKQRPSEEVASTHTDPDMTTELRVQRGPEPRPD